MTPYGRQPYGVYLLVRDHTRAVVADFDVQDLGPPTDFLAAARHYGLAAHLERSKSKGYHVWMFLEERGVSARKARLVVRHILAEIGKPLTEVFPKQDSLNTDVQYGNFIYTPLFGNLVPHGRTVFVDPADPTKPLANQWGLLESVQRVPEALLDQIIEINDLGRADVMPGQAATRSPDAGVPCFGLPPCARRMLADGVVAYQRVACFRLAIHLRRAGLPRDAAVATLRSWADKNRPQAGERIIIDAEIVDQTRSAYDRNYRGCGCEDPAVVPFCSSLCPIHSKTGQSRPRGSDTEHLGESSDSPISGSAEGGPS